jgi:hypothetical protein
VPPEFGALNASGLFASNELFRGNDPVLVMHRMGNEQTKPAAADLVARL